MIAVIGALVGWELGLVVLLVVLLFGSSLLPKLARALRQTPKEFKRGRDEGGAAGKDRDGR